MSRSLPDISRVYFRRYGAQTAGSIRASVQDVYLRSYDQEPRDDRFRGTDAFMMRFDAYTAGHSFDMVVAYIDQSAIGQAWGWPLSADSQWWTGLEAEPEPGFTHEDGTRTFGLSEIMVARGWTGLGLAHKLHDTLLTERHELRAVLLVNPANARARSAYLRWGWREVGFLRPRWDDAPRFEVLTLDLRGDAHPHEREDR